jgi:type II secretion system protein H
MRFAFIMKATVATNLGHDVKIRRKSGFSLVELIIVIALIGIMTAIAAPNFTRYRDNTNLREAARDISSDLQLYKQQAIAENVRYRITFDSGANNYVVQKTTTLAPNVFNPPLITKDIGSGNAIETSTAASFGGNPYVTFLPRGTIEEAAGGSLTLRHKTRLSTAKINVNMMGRTNVEYTIY